VQALRELALEQRTRGRGFSAERSLRLPPFLQSMGLSQRCADRSLLAGGDLGGQREAQPAEGHCGWDRTRVFLKGCGNLVARCQVLLREPHFRLGWRKSI
jgi:hypothetical protein